MLTLVCGYRRTGKDYLYNLLSKQHTAQSCLRVYKNPLLHSYNITNYSRFVRISFADLLKREAVNIYGLPTDIPDNEKDDKCYEHYKTGEMVSARDVYMEWGQIRRDEDPDYWCKLALQSINDDRNTNYVVTDWRFSNELDYARSLFPSLITLRIYRSVVEEPSSDIISEHDLDNHKTDLLVTLDSDEEFINATKRFPQYSNYILSDYI